MIVLFAKGDRYMNKHGFSLMELMIVVAIVGIIAAIAIPSYSGYVTRTRRADAVTALETIALDEEKNFAEKGQYDTIANLVASGYPNPNADANRNYNIAVSVGGGGSSFVATATGMNDQAGDAVVFAIDSDGTRGTDDGGGGVAANDELWRTLRP